MNTISTLRHELLATTANISTLEAQVTAAQERLRFATEKAAQIRILLGMLEAEAQAHANDMIATVPEAPRPPVVAKVSTPDAGRAGGSKADRMEAEVRALLAMRGTAHRKEILAHLIEKEIMGHEKAPLAHLAAFLSTNRDSFESDGKGNFKLRRVTFEGPGNKNGEELNEPAQTSPPPAPRPDLDLPDVEPGLFSEAKPEGVGSD